MEIAQKLVAVALVAIVSKIEGMMMPVGVTLVMAVTSCTLCPYSQPQAGVKMCKPPPKSIESGCLEAER